MRFTGLVLPVLLVGVVASATHATAQGVRIEAESGALNGFSILQAPFFSAGAATTAQVVNPSATYTFSGWDGPYDIAVAYCDEDDGTSSYALSGSAAGAIASWLGDLSSKTNDCNPTSLKRREIATSVVLEQGETITLECLRDGLEPCRVDFFDFRYVGPMPPVGERAFPGAMGFGALASGARGLGAEVCVVTTTADSGLGSFRGCAERAAPVYITFAVSGYIDLADVVRITGNKTIECATAPGDGVAFRRASVDVIGDNVVLRGCRMWPGKEPSEEPLQFRDGIFVQNGDAKVHHVNVANNSMMLGTDENGGTYYEVENITFQRNLLAWATRWTDEMGRTRGGFGMLIGDDVATVSAVENYTAFNRIRNPLVGPETGTGYMITPVEFVNNLIYCYSGGGAAPLRPAATHIRSASTVHVLGNRYKPCPASTVNEIVLTHESMVFANDNTMSDGSPATVVPDATSEVSQDPLFTSTISPVPSAQVRNRVFAGAGPARPVTFEVEAFEQYVDGTGGSITSVNELGGWPTLRAGLNPPDNDGDGMPNWWETAHCGGSCAPTGDQDGDGYENVEEWFHSFYGNRVPVELEVDATPIASDGNGVLEPGEHVEVAPSWRNRTTSTESFTGIASGFTGPAGAAYTVVEDEASYGPLGPGEFASCQDTGVCYRLSLNDPAVRPATHWHASFDETLSDGSTKTWTLHVGDSFTDVARTSGFYPAIEAMLHHGVTSGCGGAQYCPAGAVQRGGMAVFMLKAKEGPAYLPPVCVAGDELFGDVPASDPLCRWIEELARRNVVAGCGGGNYCPGNPVTRGQMAVFLLKTLEGGSYTPPPCSGLFSDVPCPSTFANWIEEVANRGISGGCTATQYCPSANVTRDQMAVFVSRTFGLTLYGP